MQFYLKNFNDVLKEVKSNENGLTSDEAKSRLEANGKNKLQEPPKDSLFKKFIKSLADPMIIMLLVAAFISAGTTIYSNVVTGANESYADLFIILFVVILNTILSVVQESKAENAISALMEMTKATSKVIRDGQIQIIKSEDLVVGDVIVLEAGDAIPADCRILESHSLKVEEAAITGESVPVNKIADILMLSETSREVPLGDRTNMLYSGSTIVYGRGKAVIVSTGMDTEMGKIADALAQTDSQETPLQKKMAELSKTLTKLVIGISIFVFIFTLIRNGSFAGDVILDTFLVAIALAVAAIPEGLPAVITIILSIGVTSMSKRQALVRKLTAVETLGCTQVICSDKTGTLTQNKMTVVDTFGTDKKLLAKAMALCSDAEIKQNEKEASGEPTEVALVNFAFAEGLPKYELNESYPRIGEAPFDSNRKMMSTVHNENGKILGYTKGACEILLSHCNGFLKDGKVVPLTDEIRNEINSKSKEFADRALRVLGAAYREFNETPTDFSAENLENDLIFIGFVGMIDPCRPEVYKAIKQCRTAGIRPVMITGDHKDTAVAIGKDLGIIKDSSEAMTGAELEEFSDEELIEVVNKCSVFARVQPEHKTRIVKAFKAQGIITAMTGDGVNDAPSIKAADIGISMGITGTDVTKGASDMVLADDNFATIVNAVEEGRKIYDNVRKVLQFQLSTNLAEIVAVFTSSLLGITMLTPAHLLWINMVTDSTPGLALGMEKAEGDLMKRKPRNSNESLFANGTGVDVALRGLFMGLLIIISYFIGEFIETGAIDLSVSSLDGMSMAFLTANFVQVFHAICMRSQRESLFKLKSFNWWLLGAFILASILTIGVIYIPFFTNLFNFTTISLKEFLIAFGLAFSVVPGTEIIKFFQRKFGKKIA